MFTQFYKIHSTDVGSDAILHGIERLTYRHGLKFTFPLSVSFVSGRAVDAGAVGKRCNEDIRQA